MKKLIGFWALFFISANIFASGTIAIKVTSMANISGNGAIEACGTAVHSEGEKPILITVKHDASYYTTLSAPNGVWCVVYKRWTYDGTIDLSATTLTDASKMSFIRYTK